MKIFEVMGFATFNIMVAIVLSTTFFSKTGESTRITELNKKHVEGFIETIADISAGQIENMDSFGITTYFMRHISDNGHFTSTINYNISGNFNDNKEEVMEMDKLGFISHVLNNLKGMQHHETKVNIDYIEISKDKKSASAIITTYERGMMPTVSAFGEDAMVPVSGTSFCEQQFAINDEKILQVTGATCSTNLDFSTEY